MEKVCSETQRQMLLRMADRKLQSDRTAADDRRDTIFMNIAGHTIGASKTRLHRPLSGRKSGPETARGIEKGNASDG